MLQELIAGLWLLGLIGWYAFYLQAAQPKSGTLEWIRMYDRQTFHFPSAALDLQPLDALWLLGSMLVAAGLQVAVGGIPPKEQWLVWSTPALACGGVYLLARLLCARPLLAALCAVALAGGSAPDAAAAPLSWALALFYAWMTRPVSASFWENFLLFLPAALLAAAAASLSPALYWMMPVMALLWVVVLVQRWHAGPEYGWGKLLRAIVLTLLLTAVLLAANAVAGMVSQGVLTWQQAMEAIRQGQLWRFGSLEIWLGQLWLIQHENWQENVLQHSAVILGGLFAFAGSVHRLVQRHSVQAGYLVGISIALAMAWGFADGKFLALAFLPAAACAGTWMAERGKQIAAVAMPALLCLLEIVLQII